MEWDWKTRRPSTGGRRSTNAKSDGSGERRRKNKTEGKFEDLGSAGWHRHRQPLGRRGEDPLPSSEGAARKDSIEGEVALWLERGRRLMPNLGKSREERKKVLAERSRTESFVERGPIGTLGGEP